MLIVSEPTITIAFFSLLAVAAYLAATRIGPPYEALGLIAARVSLVLVNFGFWVGSLWGDHPGESWAVDKMEAWTAREEWEKAALHLPAPVFTVGWAVLVIGVGLWAARANQRWVVTAAATFGAINFYTQWFERVGVEPWAIIVAGLTVVGIAVALWRYNTARVGNASSFAAGA
jgi:hypothetical protein